MSSLLGYADIHSQQTVFEVGDALRLAPKNGAANVSEVVSRSRGQAQARTRSVFNRER